MPSVLTRTLAGLQPYEETPTDPTMPTVDPARLNILKLEEELTKRLGKTPDFSRVSEVAKSRAKAAKEDFALGLTLSTLGGSSLAPAGGQILRKALEAREPMSVKAGEVGITDAEGNVVENPIAMQDRDVKVIQSRIDARVREEDRKANLALAQGRQADAQAAKANAEALKVMSLQIAQQNADTQRMLAEARATKLTTPAAEKPLLTAQEKNLSELQTTYNDISLLNKTFEDKYAGQGPLGRARLRYGTEAGAWADKDTQKMTQWWNDFKMMSELPTRHKIFGATLTKNELAAFRDAQGINPGADPKRVKELLTRMHKIIGEKHGAVSSSAIAQGRSKEAVEAYSIKSKEEPPSDDDALINKYLKK